MFTICKLRVLVTSISCSALLLMPVVAAQAQQQTEPSTGARRQAATTEVRQTVPRPSVSESGKAGDVYHAGEVTVRETTNSHMTIMLPMSKGGVALIEFPAHDPLYSYHEGDKALAFVNCGQSVDGGSVQCATRISDALIIQPGPKLFVAEAGSKNGKPNTIITIQRVSGMVVSFVVYPVEDAAENANRIVVSYDVMEVLAARRKAGLMTQLVSPEVLAQQDGVPLTSPLVETKQQQQASVSPQTTSPPQQAGIRLPAAPAPSVATNLAASADNGVQEKTVSELQRAASLSPKLLHYGKPVHGLALAPFVPSSPVSNLSIQVVAVRNTSSTPLRLLPDQPELRITQSTKKNEAINEQSVQVRHVATTVGDDNVLQPGETYYFAIAFDPFPLGVKQSVYVSFAHMTAVDEPAQAMLPTKPLH